MSERPAESAWLYNRPTPGIVQDWFVRNEAPAKTDFNGSKLRLHRYSRTLTDTNLLMVSSQYDWHRMRTLGMGLREGTVPEH